MIPKWVFSDCLSLFPPPSSPCCMNFALCSQRMDSPIALRSLCSFGCHKLCALSGYTDVPSSSFASQSWCAPVVVWGWLCTAREIKLELNVLCLFLWFCLFSSFSLTCLGSETITLTSTFLFPSSHAVLCCSTCRCFQGRLELLTPSFAKVYSHCLAKLSREKASPLVWVSITKDASCIAGILPFWWFLHSRVSAFLRGSSFSLPKWLKCWVSYNEIVAV